MIKPKREDWPVQFFDSFEEQEEANRQYYLSRTPEERMAIVAAMGQPEKYGSTPRHDRTFQIIDAPAAAESEES